MKRRFPAQSSLRRAAATAVAISALTLTSACSMFNPAQTTKAYVPADGVPADIGTVAMRDLLLVTEGDGTAVLSGSVINNGDERVTVQLSPQGETSTPTGGSEIELAPKEQVSLATKGLQFSSVTTEPGRLLPVAVRSSDGGTTIVRVPVLPPTGPYATLTPAG